MASRGGAVYGTMLEEGYHRSVSERLRVVRSLVVWLDVSADNYM